ncbi:MAG TPA: hypothetical protein PLT47_05650 [Bacteroidales bacterium]|nr:hypothetical protein [Bacteroidales bacterium]HQI70213.1 hypothetical protein [Bacteroidales bacterium]
MKKKPHKTQKTEMPDDFSENQQKLTRDCIPFKVPENYFEDLPHHIQERIKTSCKTATKKNLCVKYFLYPAVAAAAVAALLLVFWINKPGTDTKNAVLSSLNLSEKSITAYLEEEVDENSLIDMCSDSVTICSAEEIPDISLPAYDEEAPQSPGTAITFDSTIKNNDIIDYLVSENFEPETYQ